MCSGVIFPRKPGLAEFFVASWGIPASWVPRLCPRQARPPPPPPSNLLGGVSVSFPPLVFLLFPSYWIWTENKGRGDCISRQDLALPEITVYLFSHLKEKSKICSLIFSLKLLCFFRPNPRPGRAEQRKLLFSRLKGLHPMYLPHWKALDGICWLLDTFSLLTALVLKHSWTSRCFPTHSDWLVPGNSK